MRTTTFDAWKYGCFDFQMTEHDAHLCYHQGQCDDDVERVMQLDYIKKQLAEISTDAMVEAISEYGPDLASADRHEIEMFIVWIAAGNIVDE